MPGHPVAGVRVNAPAIPIAPGFELVPLDRLRQYPFLASLSDGILEKLQPSLVERTYAPGELVLRMGDYSDAAYYIREGTAAVRLRREPVGAALRPAQDRGLFPPLLTRVRDRLLRSRMLSDQRRVIAGGQPAALLG